MSFTRNLGSIEPFQFTASSLLYISGYSDGSGLGTLDHLMNNAGAGFVNAAFLLRKELQAAGKLTDYIATMKWYNDFGEVYQNRFEYAGTTADRMRTIALWR